MRLLVSSWQRFKTTRFKQTFDTQLFWEIIVGGYAQFLKENKKYICYLILQQPQIFSK